MSGVIKQQQRSEDELERAGFRQYARKKSLVMVRRLPADEAPLVIQTNWGETLTASAGYMICYSVGEHARAQPSDYDHWPVEPAIFEKTYKKWDEAFTPNSAQHQLMAIGCKPYYKAVGIWAKPLETGVYIQGLEHEKPVYVPENHVLAIGAEGEPYHMGDETFHNRYDASDTERERGLKHAVKRLMAFFKR
ncbi:MAG: hypothetical protein ACFE0Q_15275 [Anaerolineae bacterium]